MDDDGFLAIKSNRDQELINVWFDERLKRLERAYYIQVAENAILIPLVIAIFVMVLHI
jgi:hypothetical protein